MTVKGNDYYVVNDILDLSGIEITDISEIEGLQRLFNLKELDLQHNKITEIMGLEHLTNLQILNISYNQIKEIMGLEQLTSLQNLKLWNNQIKEIMGLEHLTNLKELYLNENPIKEEEKHFLGRMSTQEIVKYCQEKTKGVLKPAEKRATIEELLKDIREDKIGQCGFYSERNRQTNRVTLYDRKTYKAVFESDSDTMQRVLDKLEELGFLFIPDPWNITHPYDV